MRGKRRTGLSHLCLCVCGWVGGWWGPGEGGRGRGGSGGGRGLSASKYTISRLREAGTSCRGVCMYVKMA